MKTLSFMLMTLVFCTSVTAAPVITPGGVVNAASFGVPDFPNGGIAQGSIFTIFGAGLGPDAPAEQPEFPLATELAGVSVTITNGERTVSGIPVFVIAGQLNVIMPSDAPIGEVEIVVTFDGQPSEAVTATVVEGSFAAFMPTPTRGFAWAFNFNTPVDQPQNTTVSTGTIGQALTVWGTGFGGIPDADTQPPGSVLTPEQMNLAATAEVMVYVGGVPANVLYAGRSSGFPGLDQLVFEIPAGAPLGCWVPVIVTVRGIPSPAFTIAISEAGGVCSDPANPFSSPLVDGGDLAALLMIRANGSLEVPTFQPVEFLWDVFAGNFAKQTGGPTAYNLFLSLPPVGACTTATVQGLDLTAVLQESLPDINIGQELDAGPGLTLTRSEDSVSIDIPRVDGRYVDTVGGGLLGGTDPFLNPGAFTISSEGGDEVGPFNVDVVLPETVAWANGDDLVSIDRAAGATFNWTGGDPTQIVAVAGANLDLITHNAALFYCLVPSQLSSFTVQPPVLGGLPPSRPGETLGFLAVGVLPVANLSLFQDSKQPPDLEVGVVMPIELQVRTNVYE